MVRWCVGAAKCLRLLPGFPEFSSWTLPFCSFQLLFFLYTLPCLPSPRLALCPVSIMMLSEGHVKKMHIWLCHPLLETPRWPSTALRIKLETSSMAQQVLPDLTPPCSPLTLVRTFCQSSTHTGSLNSSKNQTASILGTRYTPSALPKAFFTSPTNLLDFRLPWSSWLNYHPTSLETPWPPGVAAAPTVCCYGAKKSPFWCLSQSHG